MNIFHIMNLMAVVEFGCLGCKVQLGGTASLLQESKGHKGEKSAIMHVLSTIQ